MSAAHPGRLLRRELQARGLSANRLSLDLGVPSGRITDILNGRRAITADRGAARSLFRQQRAILARPAGSIRDCDCREGAGVGDCAAVTPVDAA